MNNYKNDILSVMEEQERKLNFLAGMIALYGIVIINGNVYYDKECEERVKNTVWRAFKQPLTEGFSEIPSFKWTMPTAMKYDAHFIVEDNIIKKDTIHPERVGEVFKF